MEVAMASQITVFVENRPGRISKIARVLGDAHIDIRAVTIADRGEYGLVNIITNDPDKTEQVLSQSEFSVSRKQVIAIIMEDKPGGLADVAEYLNTKDINVANAYGFILSEGKKAVLILEVDNYIHVAKIVSEGGYHILTKEELHNL